MFSSQPQAQPHRGVAIHSTIGCTDRSKTEVVRPSIHHAVELHHYRRRIQRGCMPSGHFAYFPTDALHPLSRWYGAEVESAPGVSPRAAHRTGREPLDSSGSCHQFEGYRLPSKYEGSSCCQLARFGRWWPTPFAPRSLQSLHHYYGAVRP